MRHTSNSSIDVNENLSMALALRATAFAIALKLAVHRMGHFGLPFAFVAFSCGGVELLHLVHCLVCEGCEVIFHAVLAERQRLLYPLDRLDVVPGGGELALVLLALLILGHRSARRGSQCWIGGVWCATAGLQCWILTAGWS